MQEGELARRDDRGGGEKQCFQNSFGSRRANQPQLLLGMLHAAGTIFGARTTDWAGDEWRCDRRRPGNRTNHAQLWLAVIVLATAIVANRRATLFDLHTAMAMHGSAWLNEQ